MGFCVIAPYNHSRISDLELVFALQTPSIALFNSPSREDSHVDLR